MSATRLAVTISKIKKIRYLSVRWSLRRHGTDVESWCAPNVADIFMTSATSIGGQPIKKHFAITWFQLLVQNSGLPWSRSHDYCNRRSRHARVGAHQHTEIMLVRWSRRHELVCVLPALVKWLSAKNVSSRSFLKPHGLLTLERWSLNVCWLVGLSYTTKVRHVWTIPATGNQAFPRLCQGVTKLSQADPQK
jgi:hypothetical protein